MSHALTLYRLQQTDTRLDQVQTRLREIGNSLENNPALRAAREQVQTSDSARTQAEKTLREAELNAQSKRIKLETAESNLYGGRIHNPKELQDLQSDVAALKRQLAPLEDGQLEAMLAVETAQEKNAQSQAALRQVEATVINQNSLLKGEKSTLEHERDRLIAERSANTATLPADTLQLYETLRQKKRGLAVARVTENTCGACGNELTPTQAQAARQAGQFVHCASCGRIIFSN
ncbi:MAG: hypothetical protein CO094_06010 [Anaerolineae bacterium CG_4_9_14_3_um_filter_57_17]|nr:MAG: hypothetical protein CO094_06010 [Anaerolineae bacterium CG_4_9_14_3_um_filter_57_17]